MGILYIVATPIGNLADITYRAVDVLRSVDAIFCEDTRVSKKLLNHYDIDSKLISYHSHSGFGKIKKAKDLLKSGKSIAVISDAGTPSISDPGVILVREIRDEFGDLVPIQVIPGPSAVVSALSASGAPSSSFVFLGFLPRKKGRENIFDYINGENRTVVFYESPHRLVKTLESLAEKLNDDRELIVAREMTKIHESYKVGSPERVLQHFIDNKDEVKGECVIIVSPLSIDD